MKEKKNLSQSFALVPQSFLDELSATQNQILDILSEDREPINGLGDYISEIEAAKLLSRKTTWFWKLRKAGAIPFTKVGNKVYYSKQDILKLLNDNRRGGRND